jgi:hypothetical protein
MTNDLRAAGIDARVEVVPVSPSLVGMWIDAYGADGTIDVLFDQMYGNHSGVPQARVLKVPTDLSSDDITLKVGGPAEDGERWTQPVASDALSMAT